HALDEVGNFLYRSDLQEHVENFFIGAAMERTIEGGDRRGRGGIWIDVRAADAADSVGRAILFVVGMQNKKNVERPLQRWIRPVLRFRSAKEHIQKVARIAELMGKNPLLEIALECERIALEDDYFVKRKLYPNVDFYTGLIYQSMGFPMTMFPVLFAIPRTSGWIAQWEEMLLDPEQKIARPRQIYLGHDTRHYVPIDQRS